jgi:hypothetical protein
VRGEGRGARNEDKEKWGQGEMGTRGKIVARSGKYYLRKMETKNDRR